MIFFAEGIFYTSHTESGAKIAREDAAWPGTLQDIYGTNYCLY
jgi:hypothetical protein